MSTSPTIGSNNSFWDRKFNVTERGSTIKREIFAGITSFLCVSYVLAVNPIIIRYLHKYALYWHFRDGD